MGRCVPLTYSTTKKTMKCKQCGKCGAKWISHDGENFQLYWATGAKGKEEDLAGLVCNNYGDEQCINPKNGDETGDTWQKRDEFASDQLAKWSEPHPDEQ